MVEEREFEAREAGGGLKREPVMKQIVFRQMSDAIPVTRAF